jgi:PST family polysaccharide transporter
LKNKNHNNNSYKNIIKSTSIVGGSQVINVFFRILKNKILALLIGPAGLGLINTYQSTVSLITSVAGLGVGFSGVREIAEADATKDQNKISIATLTLRRISILLGLLGMLLCILFSKPLSRFTFGSAQYTNEIRLLSLFVFFTIVAEGQTALIQGKRRIKDLASMSILGTVYGLIIGLPLIYFFRLKGIIPFIILTAVAQLITSWWYARKVSIKKIVLSCKETFKKSKAFVKLGFAFMLAGFGMTAAQYLIRVIIINKLNIEAVGIYQAANVISVLYIGIILDAMGKDYYPRLTAVANDSKKVIQSINEQTEIGILLAMPGLIATLTFAPLLIKIFYTSEFNIAYQILRWQILGIFLRVISWPMAYYFVAKGESKTFLIMETIFTFMYVILTYFGILMFNIIGLGISFFILYVFYTLFNLALLYKIIKFSWSIQVKKLFLYFSIIISLSFLLLFFSKTLYGYLIGSILTVAVSLFVAKKMMDILEVATITELTLLAIKKIKG